MNTLSNLIVPGVGGSNEFHWQSKLQLALPNTVRVEQEWNAPILKQWVKNWVATIERIAGPVQVIAHSFGCLTSLAALAQHPHLQNKVKKLVLVAPANPSRFCPYGFSNSSQYTYEAYFKNIQTQVPSIMLISENDPWLNFEDAKTWAKIWQIETHNLGQVGHINVASGFGDYTPLMPYFLIPHMHTSFYMPWTKNNLNQCSHH